MWNDNHCFCCGKDNPNGMKLDIKWNPDGKAITTYVPPGYFQGYDGIVHGGFLSMLLDEIMAQAIRGFCAEPAVTVKLEVTFKNAAPIKEIIHIEGQLEKQRGKRFYTSAVIYDKSGKVIAYAKGLFLKVDKKHLF